MPKSYPPYVDAKKTYIQLPKENWPQNSGSHLAEDDTLTDRQKRIQTDEDIVFVFLIPAVHIELPYPIDTELLLL